MDDDPKIAWPASELRWTDDGYQIVLYLDRSIGSRVQGEVQAIAEIEMRRVMPDLRVDVTDAAIKLTSNKLFDESARAVAGMAQGALARGVKTVRQQLEWEEQGGAEWMNQLRSGPPT